MFNLQSTVTAILVKNVHSQELHRIDYGPGIVKRTIKFQARAPISGCRLPGKKILSSSFLNFNALDGLQYEIVCHFYCPGGPAGGESFFVSRRSLMSPLSRFFVCRSRGGQESAFFAVLWRNLWFLNGNACSEDVGCFRFGEYDGSVKINLWMGVCSSMIYREFVCDTVLRCRDINVDIWRR